MAGFGNCPDFNGENDDKNIRNSRFLPGDDPVENKEDEDLIFIEVQHGSYFGEDDIVRIEDDYNRE